MRHFEESAARQERRERAPRPPGRRGPVRRRRRSRWRIARRLALVVALAVLIPASISYINFMRKPSSTPFGVRSVEWVRAHVSASLVNEIERTWYSWHAPSQGGPPLKALPRVGLARARAASLRAALAAERPPSIRPLIHPALPGEGVWNTTGPQVDGGPPVLVTTFRPDPLYPQMTAGVAWIDQARARVLYFPGRYEPPGSGARGPMEVPANLRQGLLATFNSGFRLEDGKGGAYSGGTLWSPLLPGFATVVGYADGRVDVRSWTGPARPPANVVFARQNLPLIVEDGRPNPNLSDGPEWGATLGNAIRVWRSGLGVDRHGNLIYAAADQQTVGSLAQILIRAGAVRAAELDINYEWVSFISYGRRGGLDPTKLLFGIDHGGNRYLSPDDRDFFAVLSRPAPHS